MNLQQNDTVRSATSTTRLGTLLAALIFAIVLAAPVAAFADDEPMPDAASAADWLWSN